MKTKPKSTIQYPTVENFEVLRKFFYVKGLEFDDQVDRDSGCCVCGNGIALLTLLPRKRKPRWLSVFRNPWTQTEQPILINKILELGKKEFPELAPFIRYDCGNMD